MKTFKSFLEEENTQGDIGTDKLTKTWKGMTPGEEAETPELLKDFETFEPIPVGNK